jgi:hypothetical protein
MFGTPFPALPSALLGGATVVNISSARSA